MPAVTTDDGVRVAYRSLGDGPKAVLLVHGWMVSGAVYDGVLEHLDCEGLRVVIPDLRGAGDSDRPDGGYTIQRYAEDILAVADNEGIGAFVVVGHSMGGQIAQWLSAHHPDRIMGAVLLCPAPAAGFAVDEGSRGLFADAGGNRDALRTILQLVSKELSPTAMERMLDDGVRTSAVAVRMSFHASRAGGFADALGSIRAPTLAVATDDPFLSPAFLRAEVVSKIRNARLAILPGPGHYMPVERPRETAALLSAFLAALRP